MSEQEPPSPNTCVCIAEGASATTLTSSHHFTPRETKLIPACIEKLANEHDGW